MLKLPQTFQDVKKAGAKAMWAFWRVRLLFTLIGIVGTILVQLTTGFWGFRENHQALITDQYVKTMEADGAFEEARHAYEVIFSQPLPAGVPSYRDIAQDYIQSIEALQNLLPSTRSEFEAYVGAIARLQRFYGASETPDKDTIDWTLFYGEYRLALDGYISARSAYLGRVAEEAGSYIRYLRNS